MNSNEHNPLLGAIADARQHWRELSACADPRIDPDIFHPAGYDITTRRRAKAVCAVCPVVEQCLSWALKTREPSGILGGLTPNERRKLKSAEKPAPATQAAPAA